MGDRFFDYDGPAVREAPGHVALLADRPEADWLRVVERTETRRWSAGATIIRAGEQDQALYLLTAGLIGVVLPHDDGAVFKHIDAPSVLGEVAFLDGGPRSVTLVALTEVELLRLSMESFEVLSAHHPELGRAILLDLGRILAARLRLSTELIEGLR